MHFGSDATACVLGGGGGEGQNIPLMLLDCVVGSPYCLVTVYRGIGHIAVSLIIKKM